MAFQDKYFKGVSGGFQGGFDGISEVLGNIIVVQRD